MPEGDAAAGVYRVQVVYYSSGGASEGATVIATIVVRAFGVAHTFTRTLTTADSCVIINVADVTFPAGTVQEISGSVDECTRGFVSPPK